MKKCAIFDMDGTIADSMWVWQEVDRIWMEENNILPSEELNRVLKTSPFPASAKYVKQHYDLKQTEEEIMHRWQELAADAYSHKVRLKEGVLEFLQYLKARGIPMILATSCLKDSCFRLMDKYHLEEYFDHVLFTQDYGTAKEKPDLFLACAKKAGVPPEECVVFEDIVPALLGARIAGMKTVAVYDAVTAEPWEKTATAAMVAMCRWEEAMDIWESL